MKNPSATLFAAAALTWCAGLPAQLTSTVPADADLADGHQSTDLPFGVPGFRTQILVAGTAIAPSTAVLTGIRFRADRPSAPLGSASVPNVTVTLSHTNVALGNLGASFAANVTGAPTVVFQGTVTLPAQNEGFAGPLPWNIAIAFPSAYVFSVGQQNLLIDIVGGNPAGGQAGYFLDAVQAGGAATPFGHAGDNPSFDHLELIASTGNSLEPLQIVPGGHVDYTSLLSFTNPPGVLLLGFLPQPAPLDLAPFGAPTHFLFVDPLAFVPHNWTPTFIGWAATVPLGIPNDPSFVDVRVFAQSVLFDATANAAGLLTSRAIETRIGTNQAPLPMQQVDAHDPLAATGTVLDFGFNSVPQPGAVPLRLEGAFF